MVAANARFRLDRHAIDLWLPISDVAGRIRSGTLSPVELTRAQLDRIDALDPSLHAYLHVAHARALEQARAAEQEIRAGRYRGPLHGIPVAVKDICATRSMPTTCASRVPIAALRSTDAAVVERLEAAGAVLLGKLNLTEFAMTWYHPMLPAPVNPWGARHWPGASSSGSGVAAAAGLAFATIGTDTLGSIRFPSAANGVVGLKPTYGRVSRFGVFPLGESLDHIGPIVRTVADAAIVLDAIAGFDPRDPTSRREPVPSYVAALERGVAGLRVGFDERYVGEGSAPEVTQSVTEAVRTLERLGATVVDVVVPPIDGLAEAAVTICAAEACAAHEETYPSRSADYGPGFRSYLALGTGFSARDYAKAHAAREAFAGGLAALFESADVLACPAMPIVSLPQGLIAAEASPDWIVGNRHFLRYTAPFNFARTPALTLPCGVAEDLPIALQLVGPMLGEEAILRAGHAFERATEWHRRRPPL